MDVVSSTPVTLWVDFEAPQGLAIPDVGTTFYSLYDGAGVPLLVQQALTPEAQATGVSIPILGIHNVIAPDRSFERRQVHVTWVADGRTHSARQAYRVIELPISSVTAEDVRTYLSINEDELADSEVDIFAAALTLETTVGRARLEDALNSGTMLELRAERAVTLIAAASLFPSLRFRIAQSKGDGTLKFERLKDPAAFDALVRATAAELAGILDELGSDLAATTRPDPVLIAFTTITVDPITGNAPAATVGG